MPKLATSFPGASDEEKYWGLLRSYLHQLPQAERCFVEALAIFHWFDEHIALHVWTDVGTDAPFPDVWREVTTLPFVGAFAGRGLTFHSLYRGALLSHLWRRHRRRFLESAARAADYFAASDDPFLHVEGTYHRLLSHPPQGRSEYRDLVIAFQDDGRFNPWHTLNMYGMEHIHYNRLDAQSAALVWESAGQFSSLHGKNEKAIEQLKTAQALYEQTGDQRGLIRVLYANAAYQSFVGRAEACKKDLQDAYDIALQMDVPLYAGYVSYRIAEQIQYEGHPTQAHGMYQRSLKWFERTKDYAMQARNLKFLAETTDPQYVDQQKTLYQRALPLFERGWVRYEQMAPQDTGFSHDTFIGGFASWKKVKRFRLFNTAIDEGDCLISLVELEDPRTQQPYFEARVRSAYTEKALTAYRRALPVAQQMKDLRWIARANLRIGDVYLQLDRPEAAAPYYRQTLADAQRVNRTLYVGWAHVGLGDIARLAGDRTDARRHYRRALTLYLQEGAHSNIDWQIKPKMGRLSFWTLRAGIHLRRLTALLKMGILRPRAIRGS